MKYMNEAEGLFFLSAIIPSSFSNEKEELFSLKQVSAPVWQTGPVGEALISNVSLSQSTIIFFHQ
jgi:hypothetical protein